MQHIKTYYKPCKNESIAVLPYYNNCECKFVASTVKCARNEKKIEYEYAMQKEDWNNT